MRAKSVSLLLAGTTVFVGVALIAGTVVHAWSPSDSEPVADASTSRSAVPATSAPRTSAPAPSTATTGAAPPPITYPRTGSATYRKAPASGRVIGTAGKLMRFHIEVEQEIQGVGLADFVAFVERTYGDPRGWTAGGDWRLQLVGPTEPADFTLYLVTPGTRAKLCNNAHDLYTSCRNGESVVLNVVRWQRSVPNYPASLEAYRQYMVNHETGHRLGHGHELCPGSGKAAPVMQQQTLGMHGCTANAWPYLNGSRYAGRSGAYNDSPPHESLPA
jgi:hypothetical protein